MIKSIIETLKCCGCEACVQVCPKQCIIMKENPHGFMFPTINTKECIKCGLCERSCPAIIKTKPVSPYGTYAGFNLDKKIRMASSSGGVFAAIAKHIIKENGVVFGARWNNKHELIHSYTETLEGVHEFLGSKYLQSKIGYSYQEAESFLRLGRKVLFSGTPCQILALKLFLKKEYQNLITVDFICHGVPSPGVFRWYLQEEINKLAKIKKTELNSIPSQLHLPYNYKIGGIFFRDKRLGWKKFSFVLNIIVQKRHNHIRNIQLSQSLRKNPYLKGFIHNLYLRPSCYNCPVKKLKSGSCITIGDFWGVNSIIPGIDDDSGVSAIIINSKNAEHLIADLQLEKVDFKDLCRCNSAISKSSTRNPFSDYFWQLSNLSFSKRIKIIFKPDSHEVITKIKTIFFKLKTKVCNI